MPEQRQEERLTVNREFNSLDAFIAEYVTNISRTGDFIRSKAPLPIGTKVNLEFNIIMDEGFETVRGVGEVPIVPPPAAIANAIYRATGKRMTDLPISPGYVLSKTVNGD